MTGPAGAAVIAVLGAAAPKDEDIKPGWVALVIVLALCAVTVLLWLSMRKQLGKVNFNQDGDMGGQRPGDQHPGDDAPEVAPAERPQG